MKAKTDYTAGQQDLIARFEVCVERSKKAAAEARTKKKAGARKANSSAKGKGKGKGDGNGDGDGEGKGEGKTDEGFPIGSQVVEQSNFLRLCEVIGLPEQKEIDLKGNRGVMTIYEQLVRFTDGTTKVCNCMKLRTPGILDSFEAGLSEVEQTFLKVNRYE